MSYAQLKITLRVLNVLLFLSIFMLLTNPSKELIPLIGHPVSQDDIESLHEQWGRTPEPFGYFQKGFTLRDGSDFGISGYLHLLATPDQSYLYYQLPWPVLARDMIVRVLFLDVLVIALFFFVAAREDISLQFQAQHADYIYRMDMLRKRNDTAGLQLARWKYVVDCCSLSVSCLLDLFRHMNRPPSSD